jgi:hypothetical protein
MKSLRFRYLVIGSLLLGISMILGLWTWNTLGELFGLPAAQVKHALAATFAALLLRWILLPGRVSHHCAFRRCRHEQ